NVNILVYHRFVTRTILFFLKPNLLPAIHELSNGKNPDLPKRGRVILGMIDALKFLLILSLLVSNFLTCLFMFNCFSTGSSVNKEVAITHGDYHAVQYLPQQCLFIEFKKFFTSESGISSYSNSTERIVYHNTFSREIISSRYYSQA